MSQLDEKINQHFAGLVVRKDLVKTVKGNAIVPTYVLEGTSKNHRFHPVPGGVCWQFSDLPIF